MEINGNEKVCEWDYDDNEVNMIDHRYSQYVSDNKYIPKGVHIMNKDESKLCRKLMSQTGLSEKEIRTHKKYRKMLSGAQVKGQNGDYNRNKYIERLWKDVTQQTKLAREHPISVNLFKYKLKQEQGRSWGSYHYTNTSTNTNNIDIDLIRQYINLPYTPEELRLKKLESLNLTK